jgi:hypothetical protein
MTNEDIVVAEIQKQINRQVEDDRLLINTLADTLRGVLRIHGFNAQLALALVGAELAARPE